MQQKNFVLFIIMSVVILVGWTWLQNQLWPVKPKKPDDKNAVVEKKEIAKKKEQDKKEKEPVKQAADVSWHRLGQEARNSILAALTVTSTFGHGPFAILPDYLGGMHQVSRYALGGEDYFLKATLTSQGAGIERLTLNKFDAADRFGTPLNRPLDLIEEDPLYPSFLLYHYPMVEKGQPTKFVPVLTLGQRIWSFDGNNTDADGVQEIRFSTRVPPPYAHLRIIKTFRLAPRDYHIGLGIEIQNVDGKEDAPAFRYQFAGAHGVPIEGMWYATTYRNSFIGVVDGRNSLWRTMEDTQRITHRAGGEAVPDPDAPRQDSFIQYAGVADQYFASLIVTDDQQVPPDEGGVDKKDILAWGRPTLETSQVRAIYRDHDHNTLVAAEQGGLAGQQRLEFVSYQLLPRTRVLLDSEKLRPGEPVIITYYTLDRDRRVATSIRRGREMQPFANDIMVRVISEPIDVKPGHKVVHKFLLYNGPLKVRLLSQMGAQSPSTALVDRYADTLHLRTLTDYGNFGLWTDLIIQCTRFMHFLLYLLHFVVGSYGLSIILLTVVVRGLMFPISRKQAMMSIKMQELAPELKKLQEKYKNDPRGRNEAMMELYRKHNVHPLGGCLPLILQLPIFMGLYYALQESVFFRQASFLWIDNLSAPDRLIWWGQGIPWISDPDNIGSMFYLGPYFNLLPVVAVVLMIVQQKMMTPPPADEQQAMQFKMMRYMMIFFGVMFYKVAAGLCIYFIASSLWGLAERRLLPKKKGPSDAAVLTQPGPRNKPRGPTKKAPEKENGTVRKLKDWWADILEQARKK